MVRMAPEKAPLKNEFHFKNKKGFGLLEILLVMLLMGSMATLLIPMLTGFLPRYTQDEFVNKVDALFFTAWQQALVSQKIHRIMFTIPGRTIQIERERENAVHEKDAFEPLTATLFSTKYTWPESIELKQFYIEGEESLQRPGIKIERLWFYIVPDGLTQSVIINAIDTNMRDTQNNPLPLSLVINPFNARIKKYDTFQKP